MDLESAINTDGLMAGQLSLEEQALKKLKKQLKQTIDQITREKEAFDGPGV